jgi:DNA-binding response OmpR family regulator
MRTVLFADDMEDVRTLACAAVQQHGYTVLATGDGFEELSLARERRDPIDLLIRDVMMPRLCGPDLCRKVRDYYPEARVVYISGYPVDKRNEATSFIQKPFTPRVLLRRVSELLSNRTARPDFWSGSIRTLTDIFRDLRMALNRNALPDRPREGTQCGGMVEERSIKHLAGSSIPLQLSKWSRCPSPMSVLANR